MEAVFVSNLTINISAYIWSGGWVPMLFLVLLLFYLILCFYFYIATYTLSVKISAVLIFVGHNFRHLNKILSPLTNEIWTNKVLNVGTTDLYCVNFVLLWKTIVTLSLYLFSFLHAFLPCCTRVFFSQIQMTIFGKSRN